MHEPTLYNIDRWMLYSKQKRNQSGDHSPNLYGGLTKITPAQRRRMKKKANKNRDDSIGGMMPRPMREVARTFMVEPIPTLPGPNDDYLVTTSPDERISVDEIREAERLRDEAYAEMIAKDDDNPANHEIDCTCIFCIPGA